MSTASTYQEAVRLVRALGELVTRLWRDDRVADAELLVGHAVAVAEEALGPTDIEVANLLRQRGILEQDSGRFLAAEASYRRALDLVVQSPERNRHEAVGILHDLALLCEATDRGDEAEALRAQARAEVASGMEQVTHAE